MYPESYVPSPWFQFRSAGNPKAYWCQPDGLILNFPRSHITIIEVKLSHTSDAWWQTRKLYEPVVRFRFGTFWTYSIVEVVHWFNPDVAFPERFRFADKPDDVAVNAFAVHIWR